MTNKFIDDKLDTISIPQQPQNPYYNNKRTRQLQSSAKKFDQNKNAIHNLNQRPTISEHELINQLQSRNQELQAQVQYLRNEYEQKYADVCGKAAEKNDFFLNLIQQMQQRHAEQINYYQSILEQYQQQKKQMSSLQNKMNQIGAGIEDIIVQSAQLSKINQELQTQLKEKDNTIEQQRKQIQKYLANLAQYQETIDEAQRLKLKLNRRDKDIVEMIQQSEKEIQSLKESMKKSQMYCATTKLSRKNCQHCKLTNLENKYSRLLDEKQ